MGVFKFFELFKKYDRSVVAVAIGVALLFIAHFAIRDGLDKVIASSSVISVNVTKWEKQELINFQLAKDISELKYEVRGMRTDMRRDLRAIVTSLERNND